ncbi:MAG: hypothetical protein ACYDEY_08810 [Acidimicrobiales bacterium]
MGRGKGPRCAGRQCRDRSSSCPAQGDEAAPGAREHKAADTCAGYLLAKKPYPDYPKALAEGWPITTGVIEGAVPFLVKDRIALTGTRCSVDGAEAVLKLRALRKNADWDRHLTFHLDPERRRVLEARYLNNVVSAAV